MERFRFTQIDNLLTLDIKELLDESISEGFRFLARLIAEYQSGINTFSRRGEGLFCVMNHLGKIVAIGGLNQDPYSNEPNIGRLRRFYVASSYRRIGVGKELLGPILTYAKENFDLIVLHTDTEKADTFYRANGFKKCSIFPESTHVLYFK
ncbi:GNAT family N-acetyltransferase [Bacillus sp. ISL-47]|uniref:GNAT family N-acetyltransferase n=1 Tax=Bacillus sp. ISL-47 TaxID=2819130 RepID=UPI001BED285F|nr:GNAT family N-acetyltransferase [Bacillus sp. ISL-47]MBT2690921.1 GNAT family N-acetyltransferase [Bacillus sp. ISL-47]MBT2710657.1 GNAT family N-acetyltransferase [Pseudomonas sp. ISL-84]